MNSIIKKRQVLSIIIKAIDNNRQVLSDNDASELDSLTLTEFGRFSEL